jgi:molybdenum cofactor cytidylyltransferase
MFSSVRAGVAEVHAASFLLLPGDLPLVGPAVYQQLLATPGGIVVPAFRGRRGHPVLFRGAEHRDAILAQPPGATLRDYVEISGSVTVDVADEAILMDLDTPADYDALRALWRERGPVQGKEHNL